jgi:GNAT superfamily N-acetyltransferase
VTEIEEIGAGELERFLAAVAAARGRSPVSAADLLAWRGEAEDMAWFVAVVDGEDAGAGLGIVGWHATPGIGTCQAYVMPSFRAAGVGTALYAELARWLSERGCAEFESAVDEHDGASLAWALRRGLREVGRSSRPETIGPRRSEAFRRLNGSPADGDEPRIVVLRGLLAGAD